MQWNLLTYDDMASKLKFLSGFLSGTVASVVGYAFYHLSFEKPASSASLDHRPIFHESDPNLERKLRAAEILKYGAPDRGPDMRYYANHVLCYDRAKKIPLWVAEHITKYDLQGKAYRKGCNFVMDPFLDPLFASQNSDFKRSGWSRGHMAPAGDNKFDQVAMDETFYLSNVLPQDIQNNGGFWNRFEIYTRGLTEKYHDVRVISGPLMLPTVSENGKQNVQYEVVGKNLVAAPTHLYKVIELENPYNSREPSILLGAFIVPNKPIAGSEQLHDYQVPLEYLEKFAGLRFLPGLDRSRAKDLCLVEGCQMISQETLELYFIGRKLEHADTMHRLETVWTEYVKKNSTTDEYLQNLYSRKRTELSSKSTPTGG